MTAVVDDGGTVRERYSYEAYGKTTVLDASRNPKGAAPIQPYGFTGRRMDFEEGSGLYYYRLRYYDPAAGRFVSRDPLGMWGDPAQRGNAQNYCGNDPVNRMDPLGLQDAAGATVLTNSAAAEELRWLRYKRTRFVSLEEEVWAHDYAERMHKLEGYATEAGEFIDGLWLPVIHHMWATRGLFGPMIDFFAPWRGDPQYEQSFDEALANLTTAPVFAPGEQISIREYWLRQIHMWEEAHVIVQTVYMEPGGASCVYTSEALFTGLFVRLQGLDPTITAQRGTSDGYGFNFPGLRTTTRVWGEMRTTYFEIDLVAYRTPLRHQAVRISARNRPGHSSSMWVVDSWWAGDRFSKWSNWGKSLGAQNPSNPGSVKGSVRDGWPLPTQSPR